MFRFTIEVANNGRIAGDQIMVHSSLDRTHKLAVGTVEDIVVGANDVTVIRNYSKEETAHLHLRGLRMDADGFVICQPSRQQSFKLWRGRAISVDLGPDESMVVRSHIARDPYTKPLAEQIASR